MKSVRQLLLFSLPLFLLAGCSKDGIEGDGPEIPGQNGDITFAIGFAPQGGAAYAQADGTPQTRVATDANFRSAWEDGDEIGIFAVAHGQSLSATASANYINNAKLTYSSASGGSWTASENLWWPTTASGITSLDFYAYCPYVAGVADPTAIAFNVLTDQSAVTDGKSNYNLSDLLTAKSENGAKGSTVTLTFAHALAMVQVSVPSPGKGFGPGEDLKVTLRGVRPGAAVDLGAISATTPGSEISVPASDNDATAITMYRVERPGDTDYETSYTYRALVPAQTAQGGSLFWFEHEGRQLLQDGALGSALAMTAGRAETFTRTLPITLLHTGFVPAGTFLMGSSDGSNIGDRNGTGLNTTSREPNREPEENQHWVTLTQDFYMSKYEITNTQYAAFLNAVGIGKDGKYGAGSNPTEVLIHESPEFCDWGLNWSTGGDGWVPAAGCENHPIIEVTWDGAYEYAKWVGGALPTEAQWEYACRGGEANKPFGIGDGTKLTCDMANFYTRYPYDVAMGGQYSDVTETGNVGTTTAVGSYPYENGYGLYDMHGNVWEWCSDWYNYYYGYNNTDDLLAAEDITNPAGPDTGYYRLLRGGSLYYDAKNCRSAYRERVFSDYHNYDIGFRVVFVQ